MNPAVMCTGDGGSGPALGGDIPTVTVLSIMEHGINQSHVATPRLAEQGVATRD